MQTVDNGIRINVHPVGIADKLTTILSQLVDQAKAQSVTGNGVIEINFHQGGVTGAKVGLTRIIK